MKKLITSLILISLLQLSISAQNWAPFTADEKFHYTTTGDETISHTIHVDSVHVGDASTFYHMNRVIASCDTCEAVNYGLEDWQCPDNACLNLRGQSQFLQQVVVKSPGGMWTFMGENDFVLMPDNQFGQSWQFDDENSASVVGVGEELVLGQIDSTKHIWVDDGRFFILSKNHGLLRYQDPSSEDLDFELVGIQGRNLGVLIPEFFEIFDFEVGDVLQYKSESYGEGNFQHTTRLIKRTITQVEVDDDEVTVYYDEVNQQMTEHWGPPEDWTPPTTSYAQFSNFSFFTLPFFEFLSNDAREESVVNFSSFSDSLAYIDEQPSYFEVILSEENSRMTKTYGSFIPMNTASLSEIETDVVGSMLIFIEEYSPVLFQEEVYSSYFGGDMPLYEFGWGHDVYQGPIGFSFTEGLGMTSYSWAGDLGSSMAIWLTGYIHQGDTIGTVDTDSFILSTEEHAETNVLHLYPNPVQGRIYFNLEHDHVLKSMEILDMGGRVVLSKTGERNASQFNSMSTTGLSAGLYLLRLRTDEGQFLGRFLKE
jgi:hypothetical protein